MRITREWLETLDPCADGFEWWCKKYGEECTLEELVNAADEEWDYVRWLAVRCLTHRSQVKFSVFCAEKVVHLAGKEEAREAIQAAKDWLENPCKDTTAAASDVATYVCAYDIYTYANAAATYAACCAASTYAKANAAACRAATTYAKANAAAFVCDRACAHAASASGNRENFIKEAMDYILTLETVQ